MRQRKVLKAAYGRITLIKRYCPECHMYAIILDDKFQCCGRSAKDWDQEFIIRRKRESIVPGRRNPISPDEKAQVLSHQNHQCVYCGKHLGKRVRVEYDHFIPFCYSGDNNVLNIVAACRTCNQIKGPRLFNSIEEARVFIVNELESRGILWLDYFGGGYSVSKL